MRHVLFAIFLLIALITCLVLLAVVWAVIADLFDKIEKAMYQNLDDIEPCDCANCSKIVNLSAMYSSGILCPGNLICRECWMEENNHIEALAEIESIEYAMEESMIGKREGKKRIKELRLKLKL